MAHTLQISDGTTTIDFLGSSYKTLQAGAGWAPKIARRRRSQMGGRSVYEDVVETMAIQVSGTSESNCLANLQTLAELLDQAEAFGLGEGVTAVYLEYEPPSSGLANSVKAVILGPAGDSFLTMPRDFDFIVTGGRYVLGHRDDPILLSFVRRGLWLGATETKTSSASTGNPAILTPSTFTDTASIPWPYDVELDITAASQGMAASDVYFLFQSAATKLYNAEAEGLTLTNATSTSVASASAGNVALCDSSAIQGCIIADSSPGFASGVAQIAMYAVVKNLSADTVDWAIYGQAAAAGVTHIGRTTTIANSDTSVQIIKLGIFSLPGDIDTVSIVATNSTSAAAASHGLEVDYLCGIAIDDDARIVNITTSNESASSEIHIDNRLDSHLDPLIYHTNSGGGTVNDYPPFHGGDSSLAAAGNAISCLAFGVGTSGSTYTMRDGAGEVNLTLNITRTNSYLNPL